MIIPYQQLPSDTLYNLVESFVLREGTDYGAEEIELSDKVAQVLAAIRSGQVLILYSELHESVTLVSAQNYR